MLGPNRKCLPRFINMQPVLRKNMCFRSLREVMKFEDELPMLVAPASRLFSTSSFTAVPRFSTTCPEQMRWTEPRSMGRMAPAGCGLGREGQQITAVRASSKPHTGLPKRAGRGGGNRGQTGIALAAAVRPVRGALHQWGEQSGLSAGYEGGDQGQRRVGARTHSPGRSRLHRGPGGAGHAAVSSGSRPARSAPGAAEHTRPTPPSLPVLWGRTQRLNAGQWQEGGRANP